MSTPSDADRATGLRITQTVPGGLMPDTIAQALASARTDAELRAREPFLRLGEAWERAVNVFGDQGRFEAAALAAEVVKDIRRAAGIGW